MNRMTWLQKRRMEKLPDALEPWRRSVLRREMQRSQRDCRSGASGAIGTAARRKTWRNRRTADSARHRRGVFRWTRSSGRSTSTAAATTPHMSPDRRPRQAPARTAHRQPISHSARVDGAIACLPADCGDDLLETVAGVNTRRRSVHQQLLELRGHHDLLPQTGTHWNGSPEQAPASAVPYSADAMHLACTGTTKDEAGTLRARTSVTNVSPIPSCVLALA